MDRKAFRIGMLYGFASEGLTPDDVGELLIKAAFVKEGAEGSSGTAAHLGNLALALAVGLPLAAGTLAGAGAYSTLGPNYKANSAALRMQDIVNELKLKRRDIERSIRQKGIADVQQLTQE
jgi:hypothetical protein